MASPSATDSNPDEHSRGQTLMKAPPGMIWIPGGTLLMGPNDKGRMIGRRERATSAFQQVKLTKREMNHIEKTKK